MACEAKYTQWIHVGVRPCCSILQVHRFVSRIQTRLAVSTFTLYYKTVSDIRGDITKTIPPLLRHASLFGGGATDSISGRSMFWEDKLISIHRTRWHKMTYTMNCCKAKYLCGKYLIIPVLHPTKHYLRFSTSLEKHKNNWNVLKTLQTL